MLGSCYFDNDTCGSLQSLLYRVQGDLWYIINVHHKERGAFCQSPGAYSQDHPFGILPVQPPFPPRERIMWAPLGLLRLRVSAIERKQWVGSTSGRRETCPHTWRWRSWTMLVTGLDSVSPSSHLSETKVILAAPYDGVKTCS